MFVLQTIRNANCLVRASAGIRIPIMIATKGRQTGGTAIPAMASPLPFSRPALPLILTRLTIPRIIAGIAVRKQVRGLSKPSTSEAIASPLVLAAGAATAVATFVSAQLHDRHTCASSAFSVPHFGQYILISPIILGFSEFVDTWDLPFLSS
jgi:hypothetical protein